MRLPLVVAADVLVLTVNGWRCRMTCMSALLGVNGARTSISNVAGQARQTDVRRTLRREGYSSRSFSGCRCPRNRPPNVTGR